MTGNSGQKFQISLYLLIGLAVSFAFIIGLFLLCAWDVHRFSKPTSHSKSADVAIVLGAAVWGNKPSPVFQERINHALTLYQSGMVEKLIFTGGTPKEGYNTEAEVARHYAIKQGIEPNDIFFENKSKDTFQNLVNARQIMQRQHLQSAILVSDPYHMARAIAIATDLGIKATPSPTPTSRFTQATNTTKKRFFLQESYALFIYRILYWGNIIIKKIS